jgi:hypothetical protein
MTDANKIVAAIFAAGMCNKPGASGPEDYLRAYYDFLEKLTKREKATPLNITKEAAETAIGQSRRHRTRHPR